MLEKIILAEPRGFCLGVKRAIDIAEKVLHENAGKKVFFLHEIVHNDYVVGSLRKKGAVFVENINAVPYNGTVVLSAHGVSSAVRVQAAKKYLRIIDATCPLVERVHEKAKEYIKKDYSVIFIGRKGHQEVKGILNESDSIYLVASVHDVNNLEIRNKNMACLIQTTLAMHEIKGIVEAVKIKYPDIEMPEEARICNAVQERQEAVKKIALQAETIFIIGSEKSSNSRSLLETARKYCPESYIIKDASDIKNGDIKMDKIKTLGIVSSTSTPEIVVQEVVDCCQKFYKNFRNLNP